MDLPKWSRSPAPSAKGRVRLCVANLNPYLWSAYWLRRYFGFHSAKSSLSDLSPARSPQRLPHLSVCRPLSWQTRALPKQQSEASKTRLVWHSKEARLPASSLWGLDFWSLPRFGSGHIVLSRSSVLDLADRLFQYSHASAAASTPKQPTWAQTLWEKSKRASRKMIPATPQSLRITWETMSETAPAWRRIFLKHTQLPSSPRFFWVRRHLPEQALRHCFL